MAKVDNPAIGTLHCDYCGGVRSVHETQKGARKGLLYTRCPSCTETKNKCIQRLGPTFQNEIRVKATFREGFEHYANQSAISAVTESPETSASIKGDQGEQENEPPIRSRNWTALASFVGAFLFIAIGVKL